MNFHLDILNTWRKGGERSRGEEEEEIRDPVDEDELISPMDPVEWGAPVEVITGASSRRIRESAEDRGIEAMVT